MNSQDTSEDSQVLLIVDDEENLRHVLRVILEQSNFRVMEASDGVDAIQVLDDHPEIQLVLCDVRMPRMDGMAFLDAVSGRDLSVVLMSAYGTSGTAVEAIARGAVDYISKPFRPDEIRVCLDRLRGRRALEAENKRLRAAVDAPVSFGGFVGRSEGTKAVVRLVEKVAAYRTTVLLTGESGTGKEVLARALHAHSDRAHQAFIAVNCGAIPETLLESELFGHERGAFTGAVRAHPGLFEQAHGGTLLLDEIGEMPLGLQTRLLRVLEEGRVRRVGGQQDRPCDVRVVAATARDLEQMVEDKLFRDDLLYRLRVVHIAVPPLRERLEDVPLLVDALLLRVGERLGIDGLNVSDACMRVLISYPWPGNVRQLENALERALLMAEGSVIGVHDLPEEIRPSSEKVAVEPVGDDLSIKTHTASLERLLISRALERTGGNRSQAALLLDISYKALVYKIRGYALDSE